MTEAGSDQPRTVGGRPLGRRIRSGPHVVVFSSEDGLGRSLEVVCHREEGLRGRMDESAFREEARRTAEVRHEGLPPLLDAGAESGIWYAVYPAPEAPSLADLLRRGGALDSERVRLVAEGAAAALGRLATAGLRHGDIRPETVHFSRGRVVLSPRRLVPLLPGERDVRYLSPEELRGEEGTVRSDLFSLGAVLAEALRGRPPFAGSRPEEVREAIRRGLPELPPDTPPELRGLLALLLAESAEDRPGDAALIPRILSGEIRVAFPGAAGGESPRSPASPPAPGQPAPPGTAGVPLARSPRRDVGRLRFPRRGKETVWELHDHRTWLLLDESGELRPTGEAREDAPARIERGLDGDLLLTLAGDPPPVRVNGSLVSRHELADGDRIQIRGVEVLYDRRLPSSSRGPASSGRPGRSRSPTPFLVMLLLCGAILAWGGYRVRGIRARGRPVLEAADRTEREYAKRVAEGTVEAPGDAERRAAERAFASAREYARAHPEAFDEIERRLREVRRRHGKVVGYRVTREIEKLRERRRRSLADRYRRMETRAKGLIEEDRLHDAAALYESFAEDHPGTLQGDRADREATTLEEVIAARYEEDRARVEAAAAAGDFGAALDVLAAVKRYAPPEIRRQAAAREAEIRARVRETEAPGEGRTPPPDSTGRPPPGPAGKPPPPGGHPPAPVPADAPSERKAAQLLETARADVARKRWDRAADHLGPLLEPPLDSTLVARNHREEILRLRDLVRLEREGVAALFRGRVTVGRGGRVVLSYGFDEPGEEEDWVFVNPFAVPGGGSFERSGEDRALRARGVGAFVLKAVFTPRSLVLRANVRADEPHDFGFAMFEPEKMLRFDLFSVQNRFFPLGAERRRMDKNVIWIFGGGAWADTPRGEIGFVRKAESRTPAVGAGEWVEVRAAKEGETLSLAIRETPPLRGAARGDDDYVFPALQPALYVLRSDVLFEDVEIRGVPDPRWVAAEMDRRRRRLRK